MTITRGSPLRRPASSSVASLAAADAVTTALFVLFSSAWGEAAARLSAASGLSPFRSGLAVLAAGLALFDPVARLVGRVVAGPGLAGGAPCFNPAHALAVAVATAGSAVSAAKAKAASSSSSPLRAAAVRSAAQVAGGLAAALAAASALPQRLRSSLPAPAVSAGSSLKAAFAAEAVLGAILAFVVIWASVGGGSTRGKRVAVGVPLAMTVVLTVVGSELAAHAPAFNPAVAAAWSWRNSNSLSSFASGLLSHAAAFWAAPLLGALTAGAVWRIVQEEQKSSAGRTAGKARASKARSAAKSKRR